VRSEVDEKRLSSYLNGYLFQMSNKARKLSSSQIVVTFSIALIIFLIVYLRWAFYDIATRYLNAVLLSERLAHTIIGKEGYEYIFEPSTQVLIDKIKPQKGEIILYVFLEDYLPFKIRSECTFPDQDICNWMNIHMFYGHDPRPTLRKITLYASIIALFVAFATHVVRVLKSL
jgi:hypothetical protein